MDRRPITEALEAFLVTNTGKRFAIDEAPTSSTDASVVADPPYGIIYPILGGVFWGPEFVDPEDSVDLSYQITSIGLRDDQAQWMADKVRHAITGRDTNGNFLFPLTLPVGTVADRMSEGGPGGPTLEGRIFNVVDTYSIRVVP